MMMYMLDSFGDNLFLGPVPRKIVKFNPGLSQVLSKVFLSKNMLLELTKYFVSLPQD